MAEKLADELKQTERLSTYCPLTGVHVLEYGAKQFSISGLSVTWWHCPACEGWHILTTRLNQEKDTPRIEPVYQAVSL